MTFQDSAMVSFYTGFVSSQNASGNFLWVKTFGSSINESNFPTSSLNACQKITTDGSGNIYVAGSIAGDSIFYDNQLIQAFPADFFGLYVAKLAPDGAMTWIRFLNGEYNDWRNMQWRNGKLELMVLHQGLSLNGSVVFPEPMFQGDALKGKLVFSPTGTLLSSVNMNFSNPDHSFGGAFVSRFLPDGKLLFANAAPPLGETASPNSYVAILDSNLQTIERLTIRLVGGDASVSKVIIPQDVIRLSDGSFGSFFYAAINGTNPFLVVNNDTLTVDWQTVNQNNVGLFIRFSPFTCMKTVRIFPVDQEVFSNGENIVTPAGDFLTFTGFEEGGEFSSKDANLTLRRHNRNGTLLAGIPINKPAKFYSQRSQYGPLPYNDFHIRNVNNTIVAAAGRHIFQITSPSLASPDSSFAGCLSNNSGVPVVLSAPVISPGTGTFEGNQMVSMTTSDLGASIYYTDNGNLPRFDVPNSFTKLYTNPILLSRNTFFRAVTVLPGSKNSPVVVAIITIINPQLVANPAILPNGGTFEGSATISLGTSTPDAQIFYTTNGNLPRFDVPNSFTKLYTGPFTLFRSTTIRAIGLKGGFVNSSVVIANFTVNNPSIIAPVQFSPAPGSYSSAQEVSFNTATPGTTIYYTINGNVPLLNPFPNSFTRIFTGPISVNSSRTIRAFATRPGFQNSPVSVGIYSIGAGRVAVENTTEYSYFFEDNDAEAGLAKMDLFPNPTNGMLTLRLQGVEGNGRLEVYNYMGKLVQTSLISRSEETLNITQLPAGFYVVRVQSGNNTLEQKITKQ